MSTNGENRTPVKRKLTPEQKQKILHMRKMRKLKRRLKIIVPIAAILIVVGVVLLCTLGGETPDTTAVSDAVLSVSPTVESTATPAPTPEPTKFVFDDAYVAALKGESTGPVIQADMSKVSSDKLGRWPQIKEGYMPIVERANTNEKIIAITVDDCFQNENLKQIVQCALDYDGKLTIFPIGNNLTKSGIASTIKWAWESGMEIENHTYNHVGMYHYDDERMMQELYYQNQILNQTLGVNYQIHFFRPRGGEERRDQRVHAAVNQLGYNGIAHWTQSGSTDPLEDLLANLAPGNIYLFHTTDNDLNKLLQFIPAATDAGYRLVTLNEMYGLPENETSELTTEMQVPELQSFQVTPISLSKTLYTRAAAVIQKRFIELGWQDESIEPDGVFGNNNYLSTGYFQMAHGLEATGVMDVETQKLLFSDSALRPTEEQLAEMVARAKK